MLAAFFPRMRHKSCSSDFASVAEQLVGVHMKLVVWLHRQPLLLGSLIRSLAALKYIQKAVTPSMLERWIEPQELEDLPLLCQLALVHRTAPARGCVEGSFDIYDLNDLNALNYLLTSQLLQATALLMLSSMTPL